MTLETAIVIGVLVAGLLGCVGFVCWGAVRIFREAVARSRSADETVAKNLPVFMQTAAAISERVDARARDRVRIINSGLAGAPQAEDAPAEPVAEMPPMYQSPLDMETREQIREDQRIRRNGADPVRDRGIGQDDVPPPPPVRQETL